MKESIRNPWEIPYHIFMASLLITVNIYFFIFVHIMSDLAPNIALALFTLPPAYFEFKKAWALGAKN